MNPADIARTIGAPAQPAPQGGAPMMPPGGGGGGGNPLDMFRQAIIQMPDEELMQLMQVLQGGGQGGPPTPGQ